MTDPPLDVVGIGNAIVDVLAQADEAFLEASAGRIWPATRSRTPSPSSTSCRIW